MSLTLMTPLTKLKSSTCAAATFIALGLFTAATPAVADDLAIETVRLAKADLGTRSDGLGIVSDSAERMQIAGELRTLTQQIAAASCALATEIETDSTRDVLRQSISDFNRNLTALRDGDAQLDIAAPESRYETLAQLDEIRDEWNVVQIAAAGILASEDQAMHRQVVEDRTAKLLELTNLLAAVITSQYAYPHEITTADALMIEFAGRQQMLSQKMAHVACLVWHENGTAESRDSLRETMQLFEASLNALRHGMPESGVHGAPNAKIRADLDGLLDRWVTIKSNSEALLSSDELNQAQSAMVYQNIEVSLAAFDGLLHDYKEYAERAH
ncbi:type IV pili methyl-accepting chemotaxis transducer N-terminal domain-containing protein [Loktanella agnita]|uniref:type IV pili methyl-accepting chemotaxis transducer N-terminal domain-containing protein n=1 Tax=Loktanella agnita TaxID=287097 RepID=UPI00398A391E